ncbi:hypothetical protein SporoP37_15415 [Sporosarcina sp. P37]|uniref:hypothetical protein n=1 Tax=unclassified Sporosarcina TaxID=2647733 RepID=UPI0009BFF522|nr:MULTISPECIES: hypothetical protein [unclassified Sporosarcina]ARD49443.1 hypothetical protein SporoP33_15080 [Sporosarcina sp. P33]ARK25919.1 hypothetical protein SporoP37_15415 [Sporosarcina sp. P37]PID18260.1 hypothetical protein CSV62_09315 [Sporosarcina sp. P35]
MKKQLLILSVLICGLLLSGCLGGRSPEEKQASETPYPDQQETVQKAVERYQEQSGGLLPIKTRDQETDQYIKYPIEFSKIVPDFTEKIPSNAFENGGIFQYVLMDVEENPTVKLVDLRITEKLRDLNLRKFINGELPFLDPVGENVYAVDFKKMGFKEPLTVESPYSDAHLPIVVGGDGNFYVDYSIDLNKILMEQKPEIKPGTDIRYLLYENSLVLPAYSMPYTVDENNEPVFMKK